MEGSSPLPRLIRFAEYELDTRAGELHKDDTALQLHKQPLQILILLLERPSEVVSREELRTALWPDQTFVDFEDSLNHAVRRLREALGDDAETPRFIETLPRRGYRFIAAVNAVAPVSPVEPVAAVSDRRTAMRTSPLQKRWAVLLVGIFVVVAVALSIAWFATHRPPAPQLKERRLTANPPENAVNEGAISPDGKYLAYGDQTGMHLKLIQTGETINIPQPEGPAPDLDNWWPNGWFPDSTKFIAVGVDSGKLVSAWVVSVVGGPPRKLRDDADVWSVSPDGMLIALGTGVGFRRSREIWLMGPQGEEPHKFLTGSDDDAYFWTAWSPDGQRIVYWRGHRKPDGIDVSIESRDLKGGQPTVIVSGIPGLGNIFWWFPNGRFIYSSSTSEGNGNFWEVRVDTKTGEPVSEPRRITNWVEARLIAFGGTSDGKQLAVTRRTWQSHVDVGRLEAGGRSLRNPRPLTLEESEDTPCQWMPDGKTVIFLSNRNRTWGVYKQGLDETTAQAIVTGPDYKGCGVASPDGSSLLYLSRATPQVNASTPVRIMRVRIGRATAIGAGAARHQPPILRPLSCDLMRV